MNALQIGIGDALATVVLGMMLFIVLSLGLSDFGALGLAAAQLASFAAPALWTSHARTGGYRAVGLKGFPSHTLIGIALVAGSMWIWTVHWVAPIGADWASSEQTAELEALFALSSRPLWQSLLFFAFVPAICEELLHRGLLLPVLCRVLGRPVGLALSATLFGLSHFNLARLLPTAMLGLVAGSLRLRSRSLWPCVILHAGYNACLLIAASLQWGPSSTLAPLAALATALGAFWIHSSTKSLHDLVS